MSIKYRTYFPHGYDPQMLYMPASLVQIQPFLAKPAGALWASRADDKGYTWRKWVIENEFYAGNIDEKPSIMFHLKKGTRKFKLHTKEDFENLCKNYMTNSIYEGYATQYQFDFRKMARNYDVIDYKVTELYFEMYGWDCDCICVLNKDVIVVDEVENCI